MRIEKREGKKSERKTRVDEWGLAKSAAWAWYERGSGSTEGREVDVWRPIASRYKLEALRNSSNNSLLDNYEIDRISKQLDRYIEASEVNHHAAVSKKTKSTIRRGFWWRPVACSSSRNDVVDSQTDKLRLVGCRPT